jgi:hypothetical protein
MKIGSSMEIGKIKKVALRELWKKEDKNKTLLGLVR